MEQAWSGLDRRGRWRATALGVTHLEAVVLAQEAAVHGLDDHVVLHAEVQGVYRAARAEQGLVGARLLQPWHQMGPGGGGSRCVRLGLPLSSPALSPPFPSSPESLPGPLAGGNHCPLDSHHPLHLKADRGEGTVRLVSQRAIMSPFAHCRPLGKWFSL